MTTIQAVPAHRTRPRRPGQRLPAPEPKRITEPDKRFCAQCLHRVVDTHELAEHYREKHGDVSAARE